MQNVELEELLSAIRANSGADPAFSELARRYEPMMRSKVYSMFGDSFDYGEAFQEANIALHNAAITYDREKCEGVTFGLYASICVVNRLRSLLRKRRRDNDRTDKFTDDDNIIGGADVESFVVNRDLCDRVLRAARGALSDFEYTVFKLQLEGYTTRDIAKRLSHTAKSVDNAKNRLSKKLKSVEDIRRILYDI